MILCVPTTTTSSSTEMMNSVSCSLKMASISSTWVLRLHCFRCILNWMMGHISLPTFTEEITCKQMSTSVLFLFFLFTNDIIYCIHTSSDTICGLLGYTIPTYPALRFFHFYLSWCNENCLCLCLLGFGESFYIGAGKFYFCAWFEIFYCLICLLP